MSRIIIKNIPHGVTEEELRSLFGAKGHITDCSLKFTQDGVFRKFAFLGYQSEQEAVAAVKYFNRSFIRTSRIQVEKACDMGDRSKPRAWSKYATDSSAFQKQQKQKEGNSESDKKKTAEKKESKKKKKADKLDKLLADVKDDPEFEEFLQVHTAKVNKVSWANDEVLALPGNREVTGSSKKPTHDASLLPPGGDEEDDDISETSRSDETLPTVSESPIKKQKGTDQSDLEFLKSKMSNNEALFSSDSDGESDSECHSGKGVTADSESHSGKGVTADNDESKDESSEGTTDSSSAEESESESADKEPDPVTQQPEVTECGEVVHYIVKIKGLSSTVKENQIREFFKPITPTSVKIPRNARGKKSFCIATVEFATETDQESAMRRNKNFIGPKRIFLHKSKVVEKSTAQAKIRPWEIKLAEQSEDKDFEGIAESGRLYVRNLAYVCQEGDLEELFSQYGPVSEIHLPIDSFTKKIKGFAFVTYMIPEHAVKAFTALDGKTFQGRLLHILPAQPKRSEELEITDDMPFKKKKELQQKKQATSSHNWNSLFLGANAVADLMAQKYGKSKGDILDADQRQSLGVRMALGETQIVSETRQFLLDNGIVLDSFSQAGGPRSKTAILVKNLPVGTLPQELKVVFEKFGELGRVVLPPTGVTAVLEFIEETEAKQAFRNLAYTKFKHIPLYLEWAPMGVFKQPGKTTKEEVETMETNQKDEKQAEESGDSSDEDAPEPDTTLFVKNLNFDTTEDTLREHFQRCGPLYTVTVAKKQDNKNPGKFLSMGYGFVQYKKKSSVNKALKQLQHSKVDSHQIEVKLSNRATISKDAAKVSRKRQDPKKKQTTSKILVRNIPFEAKEKELRELFSVFGELKSVRLPKKLQGTGPHRGFAFVDFISKQDAKRSFNTLCHSTHLYGRRLVLEWADTEETVEQLREKTAQHYHQEPAAKRLKKSAVMEKLQGLE